MTSHSFVTLVCEHCGATIRIPNYCGNRFCSVCSKPRQARIRRRIISVLHQVQPRRYDSLKLLTLTIPRRQPLRNGVDQLLTSFRRLRQRKFWKKNVRGGAYFIEFKHSPAGWNPHLHIILESSFIPVKKLSELWSKVSPGKIVDIRKISQGSVVNYVTKYVTKADVPEPLQLQASEVLANRRLFTLFGTWGRIKLEPIPDEHACNNCGQTCWRYVGESSLTSWSKRSTFYAGRPQPNPP